MPVIRDCSLADITTIQQLVKRTWWPTYQKILSIEQIQYMLEAIYSEDSLAKVMIDQTQHFILVEENNVSQGFAAYGSQTRNPGIYKLHKLYVDPLAQGMGFGKLLIEEIKKRLQSIDIHTLDLNVNRYNPAKTFYEHLGFTVIKEEDIPIGPYWMNDYVMRITF